MNNADVSFRHTGVAASIIVLTKCTNIHSSVIIHAPVQIDTAITIAVLTNEGKNLAKLGSYYKN